MAAQDVEARPAATGGRWRPACPRWWRPVPARQPAHAPSSSVRPRSRGCESGLCARSRSADEQQAGRCCAGRRTSRLQVLPVERGHFGRAHAGARLGEGARGSARQPEARPTPTRVEAHEAVGAAARPAGRQYGRRMRSRCRRSRVLAGNSWSTPAAAASAMLEGVWGSGGMAESPRPGMSGTHQLEARRQHRDGLDPMRPRAGAAVEEQQRLAGAPHAPHHAAVATGRAVACGRCAPGASTMAAGFCAVARGVVRHAAVMCGGAVAKRKCIHRHIRPRPLVREACRARLGGTHPPFDRLRPGCNAWPAPPGAELARARRAGLIRPSTGSQERVGRTDGNLRASVTVSPSSVARGRPGAGRWRRPRAGARARPLKQVSAMWWLLSPYRHLDVQRDAGVLREGLEPLAEQLGVHLADLGLRRRRPSRSGRAAPTRRPRRGSASRPWAGAGEA